MKNIFKLLPGGYVFLKSRVHSSFTNKKRIIHKIRELPNSFSGPRDNDEIFSPANSSNSSKFAWIQKLLFSSDGL